MRIRAANEGVAGDEVGHNTLGPNRYFQDEATREQQRRSSKVVYIRPNEDMTNATPNGNTKITKIRYFRDYIFSEPSEVT